MSMILPTSLDDLLNGRGIESARIEYKAAWNSVTSEAISKTICAFANDLQNLNGGYLVIGVEEDKGAALLPPRGLDPNMLERIQKQIRGQCKRLDPEYQPVISPEKFLDKHLLVIWAPGSETRPHQAPADAKGERKYFVRLGSETVVAQDAILTQLMQLTARVPYDDRRRLDARSEDLNETKVREYLKAIDSGLLNEPNPRNLYRKLQIAVPVNGHDAPKNIGLMLFSDTPETFFPCSKIEVAQFAADVSGDLIEEKTFHGGLHEQLRNTLAYLDTIPSDYKEKQPQTARVRAFISYPVQALREALANAIYHRDYETSREPVKVYLYPNRIEIISYPGPVTGIEMEDLLQQRPMPPVPARNRRIGEFLKSLRLAEGRGTGLPKIYRAMKDNGSPEPRFEFDKDRTYFKVTLPAHPEYTALSALRNAAYLRALGREQDAFERIHQAWTASPGSPTLSEELLKHYAHRDRFEDAESVFQTFKSNTQDHLIPHVTNVLIDLLLIANRSSEAAKRLKELPQYISAADSLDAAILARRTGNEQEAHRYFERAGDAILSDSRALHEFAQSKMRLSKGKDRATNSRMLEESRELLERVVRLDADRVRHAWAWRDLAHVRTWLKRPAPEIQDAYEKAIDHHPDEPKFKQELDQFFKTYR